MLKEGHSSNAFCAAVLSLSVIRESQYLRDFKFKLMY